MDDKQRQISLIAIANKAILALAVFMLAGIFAPFAREFPAEQLNRLAIIAGVPLGAVFIWLIVRSINRRKRPPDAP